jgi:hypothetical protein
MNTEDLAAFFRSLPPARRKEYDALAELDRRLGENVETDRGGGAKKTSENVS